MATTEQLQALLAESRNGCNHYIRHPLARRFVYTDGVKAMADLCGAYWLLDIIGTEAVPALIKDRLTSYADVGLIEVNVRPQPTARPPGLLVADVLAGRAEETSNCLIELTVDDDAPAVWKRAIEYTDFPVGSWVFKLGLDQDSDGAWMGVMCLLSED